MEDSRLMSPERQAAAEPVRSRWTPKPEQILILESIFNSGMVNPPKDETVRIRKLLERFGAVGDANVFYWFQNRRSRSRRRQRQLQLQAQAQAAAAAGSSSSSGSPPPTSAAGLAPASSFAHGATYGSSSASASWQGMMGDLDCGGGDDLFAISRQMGYADGGGSGSAAMSSQQQQQLYYSCQSAGERRAVHACFATQSLHCWIGFRTWSSSWALYNCKEGIQFNSFFEFGSALHAEFYSLF